MEYLTRLSVGDADVLRRIDGSLNVFVGAKGSGAFVLTGTITPQQAEHLHEALGIMLAPDIEGELLPPHGDDDPVFEVGVDG